MLYIIQWGDTGLMEACEGGYTDTIKALLEAKADPNITRGGWSPILIRAHLP